MFPVVVREVQLTPQPPTAAAGENPLEVDSVYLLFLDKISNGLNERGPVGHTANSRKGKTGILPVQTDILSSVKKTQNMRPVTSLALRPQSE